MKRSDLEKTFFRHDEEQRREFILSALEDDRGRSFLWWLLRVGKAIQNQPFDTTPERTAFNCGEMNVGSTILAEILFARDDALPILMLAMNQKQSDRRNQLSDAKEDDDD